MPGGERGGTHTLGCRDATRIYKLSHGWFEIWFLSMSD